MGVRLSKKISEWIVYIIKSSDDSLYTGITTDVKRRWSEHCELKAGAKFFRGRKPKSLMFVSQKKDRSEATKSEMRIKKLKRIDKFKLIDSDENQINKLNLVKGEKIGAR